MRSVKSKVPAQSEAKSPQNPGAVIKKKLKGFAPYRGRQER